MVLAAAQMAGVSGRRWRLRGRFPDGELEGAPYQPLIRHLLWHRGLRTIADAAAFLEARDPAFDPMLLPDIGIALDRLQAAIAAVHDEAPSAKATDWPQILALYEVLEEVSPGPVVTLNRAVAVARVHGPRAGLALLGTLDTDERMAYTHRLEAVRGHLLEQAGDLASARESYQRAARMTASLPEQRYLALRAARLD
jgi:hypothetical protein